MTKLLPCPFCGGEAKVFSISCSDDENDDILDHVFCTACDASMCQQDKSVEMWNNRAPQWQPIETAPMDGTYILLNFNDKACIGGAYVWLSNDGFNGETIDYPAWTTDDDLIIVEDPYSWPTHWMPLPPPPKENE